MEIDVGCVQYFFSAFRSLGTLAKEPELLVKLDEPVVKCILQRNDLPLEEVEVFNFLVKYAPFLFPHNQDQHGRYIRVCIFFQLG